MSDFNLNDHVYRLLQSEPFFAALSRRIEKKMNKSIPTAGVRVNEDGYFEMVYNPDFFEPLTDKQRTGVLVHEFYHLVFEHVTGVVPELSQGEVRCAVSCRLCPQPVRDGEELVVGALIQERPLLWSLSSLASLGEGLHRGLRLVDLAGAKLSFDLQHVGKPHAARVGVGK